METKKRNTLIIVAVSAVVLAVVGFIGLRAYQFVQYMRTEGGQPKPGESEFREANRQITRFKGTTAFGNSPEAVEMATKCAQTQKTLRVSLFTGGKRGALSAAKGEFLTYCQLRDNACVFLVHVPELRQYTSEAKKALRELTWLAAQQVVKDSGTQGQSELVVALRGAVAYESIQVGKPTGESAVYESAMRELNRLYPYFEKVTPAAPAKQIPTSAPTMREIGNASEILPGKWTANRGTAITEVTFEKEGSFHGSVTDQAKVVFTFEGQWSVTSNVFLWVYQKTSPPLPSDKERDVNKVLELTANSLLLEEADQSRTRFTKTSN